MQRGEFRVIDALVAMGIRHLHELPTAYILLHVPHTDILLSRTDQQSRPCFVPVQAERLTNQPAELALECAIYTVQVDHPCRQDRGYSLLIEGVLAAFHHLSFVWDLRHDLYFGVRRSVEAAIVDGGFLAGCQLGKTQFQNLDLGRGLIVLFGVGPGEEVRELELGKGRVAEKW